MFRRTKKKETFNSGVEYNKAAKKMKILVLLLHYTNLIRDWALVVRPVLEQSRSMARQQTQSSGVDYYSP